MGMSPPLCFYRFKGLETLVAVDDLCFVFNRHSTDSATQTGTDDGLTLITGFGNDLCNCALDEDITALAVLAAADTSSMRSADSCDLTTTDGDVATRRKHLTADAGTIFATVGIDITILNHNVAIAANAGTFLAAKSVECTLSGDGQGLLMCSANSAVVSAE